jgi:hypothetical protein
MPAGDQPASDPVYDMTDRELKRFQLVRKILTDVGVDLRRKEVTTSRDPRVISVQEESYPSGVPKQMQAWQRLILASDVPAESMCMTTETTHTSSTLRVGLEGRHYEFSRFVFVAAASIIWEGIELMQLDWLYIPSRVICEYQMGSKGVILLHKHFPYG